MPNNGTVREEDWLRKGYHTVTTVSSTGTGSVKIYHVLSEYYDPNGNLLNSRTYDWPLVPQIEPSIDKNTVRITTPIDIDYIQTHSSRDGIDSLCANCTKLEEFDFTTDVTYTSDTVKGNFFNYAFLNCESLRTINIDDVWSNVENTTYTELIAQAGNNSLCCFMNCKNLETITGVFNFADNLSKFSPSTSPGWSDLEETAEYMFYGCDKLTGVQIHLTGDSTSFINDKVYETLGLKLNQFTLV